MNNQKGQILLVVFMLLLFTGLIVGGIAFLWQSGSNTAALEKDSLRAFYLAQAGNGQHIVQECRRPRNDAKAHRQSRTCRG